MLLFSRLHFNAELKWWKWREIAVTFCVVRYASVEAVVMTLRLPGIPKQETSGSGFDVAV